MLLLTINPAFWIVWQIIFSRDVFHSLFWRCTWHVSTKRWRSILSQESWRDCPNQCPNHIAYSNAIWLLRPGQRKDIASTWFLPSKHWPLEPTCHVWKKPRPRGEARHMSEESLDDSISRASSLPTEATDTEEEKKTSLLCLPWFCKRTHKVKKRGKCQGH